MSDPRPRTRQGKTYQVKIGDQQLKLFITTGEWPEGQLKEIFIAATKQGTLVHGLIDSLALMASHALQADVPVLDICRALYGRKFEPDGSTDDPEVPECLSISDYLAKRLALDYLTEREQWQLGSGSPW